MDTREAVASRIRQLCAARKITPNGLANLSAVPQATIKIACRICLYRPAC